MFSLRSWATPITIGSFVISAVTGIILFFHWNLGLAKPAHEWLSWFMVLGVGMHLFINWRAFKNYFSQRIPVLVIGTFTLLTVLSLLPLTGDEGNKNPRAALSKMLQTAEQAPLSSLAVLAKITPEALVESLKQQGLNVANAEQTLAEVAADNGKETTGLIPLIFH